MNADKTLSLNTIPAHPPDIVQEVVEGEILLYHPTETEAFYLNGSASMVWALCDGKRSIDAITQMLQEAYPESAADLAADVMLTLADLSARGMLVIA